MAEPSGEIDLRMADAFELQKTDLQARAAPTRYEKIPGVLVPAGFVGQYREVWPVYLIEHEIKPYRYRLALLQEFVRAVQ